LAIKPDDPIANSNLLFMLAYRGEWPADSYLREARSWDVRMLTAAQRQAAQTRTFSRSDVTSRKLRVGYVSGDFRQHAVAVFFEQILANRDHGRSEVWLYSNNISEDAVSERLKAMAVHWIPVSSLSDQALCDLNRTTTQLMSELTFQDTPRTTGCRVFASESGASPGPLSGLLSPALACTRWTI
jgi:protein O-GlcNAc transferase